MLLVCTRPISGQNKRESLGDARDRRKVFDWVEWQNDFIVFAIMPG
jgi:hypothetical protein